MLGNLPTRLDRVLADTEHGKLTVQNALAPDAREALRRLERGLGRLTSTVLAAALLITGVILHAARPDGSLGQWLIGAALVALLWGLSRNRQ